MNDISNLKEFFEDGCFDKLAHFFGATPPESVNRSPNKAAVFHIFLATGALGYINSSLLKEWLAIIPENIRPDLRYRAMINAGLWTEAAIFRHAEEHRADQFFQSVCRLSASLFLLSRQRLTRGFSFYHHRLDEDGKYKVHLRRVFDYRPIYHETSDIVFLEQGVGDRFLHLAHLKSQHPESPLKFACVKRWEPVLSWLFPDDEVLPLDRFSTESRLLANASGDYLVQRFLKSGSIAPKAQLGAATQAGPPKFGVVWRGGAGGNKRDERKLSLDEMLTWLGTEVSLVALQPRLSEEELKIISANRNVYLPAFDVTNDLLSYAKLISGLAGVIGVDNTATHVAGVFGVPSYTLMNRSAHWYWGKEKDVSTVYPNARTIPLGKQNSTDIDRWINQCRTDYAQRSPTVLCSGSKRTNQPVLVTGVPRSGTSLTMGLLQRCGLWLGTTVPGGVSNPDGFFENTAIREGIVKPLLKNLGFDPLGVKTLPTPAPKYVFPDLRERVLEIIQAEGYSGSQPWGYKGAKMALVWNIWAEAFPDATWIIVSRNVDDVVRSCLKTHFMSQHSTDPMFWRYFHEVYTQRLNQMRSSVKRRVIEVRYEDIIGGDLSSIDIVCKHAGLTFDLDRAQGLVR